MPDMVLRAGYLNLALRLQEAADSLSANDTRARLSDAINDHFRGTGTWAYYTDHFGDADSGDVVYSCGNDTRKAPYEISSANGAAKCVIDFEAAKDVVPRTVYEEEIDEQDHYATMEESFKAEKIYTDLPLYERFIPKSERDGAMSDDFAGKGRSFPILKPEDVMAAVRSIGRAGSGNLGPSGIRGRIIAIAKRKGWEKYLPKAWRDAETKESKTVPVPRGTDTVSLIESASCCETIELRETKANYEIKLIAPGKGSSAFYPAEVLKRDGPKVFKVGTHVYLNHPTKAEESARPEGDVKNLAGVLTAPAVWHDQHAKGPGLYGRMKVFADHAESVQDKAPYVGMSIRASGVAESDRRQEGLPVLKELVSAESVDVVTRAGAGGMILTEAATKPQTTQEVSDMDAAEITKLQESLAVQAASNEKLLKRAIQGDARELANTILRATSLQESARERVIQTMLDREIPVTDGDLNRVKFTEAVNAEAKREGEYVSRIAGSGRVLNMGAPAPTQESTTPDPKKLREAAIRTYCDMGMPPDAAERAAMRDMEEVA